MLSFVKKQLMVGMGVLVLLLALAQLLDRDYRRAAITTLAFGFGFVVGTLLARYRRGSGRERS